MSSTVRYYGICVQYQLNQLDPFGMRVIYAFSPHVTNLYIGVQIEVKHLSDHTMNSTLED
jgi:hypothetical protein